MESCRHTDPAAAWTRKSTNFESGSDWTVRLAALVDPGLLVLEGIQKKIRDATGTTTTLQGAETFVLRRIGGSLRVRSIPSDKRLAASSKLCRAKAAQ